MANLQKIYTISIELDKARQDLASANKLLEEMKVKSAAANQEVKETKAVYDENTAALKELVQVQRQLEAAKKSAPGGEGALTAQAALDRNIAAQKQLNSIIQESKIDYVAAKDAASAVGQAIGKQVGTVKELAAAVKEYGGASKAAQGEITPGSIGALKQEVVQLEAALEGAAYGSKEAAAVLDQLAAKKAQVAELADRINSLNPRRQIESFVAFSNAVTGAFTVATVSAQVFGLSSVQAQEYQQKLVGLIGVMNGVEQISRLLNGANLATIKSTVQAGRAWLAAGEAASTGSKVARAALISSGVGILLLALGVVLAVVVENWDKLTGSAKGSVGWFAQVKAVTNGLFSGAIEEIKTFFGFLYDLVTLDFSGAAERARNAGRDTAAAYAKGYAESIKASNREAINLQNAQLAREIELAKAQGKETLQLQIDLAQKKLDNLADETQQEKELRKDAQLEIDKLKAEQMGKGFAEQDALTAQHLTAQAQLLAAKGKEAFAEELAAKEEQLVQLEAAFIRNEAAIEAKRDEIAAFQAAHAKLLDDRQKAQLLAQLDGRIALVQAKGLEAYGLQVAREELALKQLQSAGTRNEAEITAQLGRIAALRAAHAKEVQDKANAADVARLQAEVTRENAQGANSYAAQVALEEKKLALLKAAGIRNQAAIIDQQAKIDGMAAARALKEENDARALGLARTQVEIAMAQARGEETIDLQLKLKRQELTGLLAALDQNAAAIAAKEGEIAVLKIQQEQREFDRRRAMLEEQQGYELALYQKKGKDTLELEIRQARERIALDTDTSEKGLKQRRADFAALQLLLQEQKQRLPDLGGALLKALGVKPEDVQQVKAAITQAVSEVYGSLQQLAGVFLDGAIQAADQQLQAVQDRMKLLDQQVQENKSAADKALAEVEKSTGARRDFYLQQLEKERAKTEQLQSAKRKAAAEEKKQTEEKHRLEKLGQEIAAASALATNTAAAAAAVYAGIKAVSAGSEIPFPGNLVAIAAGIAAVVAAVASAKQLSNATKYADGTGALDADGILRGNTHAQGGIQLFSRDGKHYGEAEDGEAITPADASAKNAGALKLIRTAGRTRVLTPADFAQIANVEVKPSTPNYFANGTAGLGAGLPAGMVAISQADLSELVSLTRQVVQHTNDTARSNEAIQGYGPSRVAFGNEEVVKLAELTKETNDSKAAVSLG